MTNMKTYYIVEKVLWKIKTDDEEKAWEEYYDKGQNIDMSKKLYKYKPKI